jgi:hypothetical protein
MKARAVVVVLFAALCISQPVSLNAFAQSDVLASRNDGAEPVGINRFIGRRPISAFGNSDGDLQMPQWTMAGKGMRFAGLVHHTDAEREYAYDRESKFGKLDGATAKGWVVVDMKRDWKAIFPDGTR